MRLLFAMTENGVLRGVMRKQAEQLLCQNHYLHTIPSGKSHVVRYESAIVVWSIPPNMNISAYLVGRPNVVWELSRLWAPDGHRKNLLTQAIAFAVGALKREEPTCAAVVSYADPNVGHQGGVYKAASWIPCGQCEEGRYYVRPDGTTVARRSFHSGDKVRTLSEIKESGILQLRRPGKLRFAFPVKPWARRELLRRFAAVDA